MLLETDVPSVQGRGLVRVTRGKGYVPLLTNASGEVVVTLAATSPRRHASSPRDLATRPLLRHPALAISGAGASKQDVQDATCIEELLNVKPGPEAAAAAAA